MISDGLKFRINESYKSIQDAFEQVKDSAKIIREAREKFPLFFDTKADYETLLLEVCNVKHLSNEAYKISLTLSQTAEAEYQVLKSDAMMDGVYEYYSALEIPKTKVTQDMRESYAYKNQEIKDMFKLVSEAKAMTKFLEKETELLVGTEHNFRGFCKRVGGL